MEAPALSACWQKAGCTIRLKTSLKTETKRNSSFSNTFSSACDGPSILLQSNSKPSLPRSLSFRRKQPSWQHVQEHSERKGSVKSQTLLSKSLHGSFKSNAIFTYLKVGHLKKKKKERRKNNSSLRISFLPELHLPSRAGAFGGLMRGGDALNLPQSKAQRQPPAQVRTVLRSGPRQAQAGGQQSSAHWSSALTTCRFSFQLEMPRAGM